MTAGLKLSNWPAAPGCHCGSGKPYAPRRCRLPAESRAEESAAYAIDYREAAPVSIRAAIDNIVGSVKAWLLKTFGLQLGAVTAGELAALAKAALPDGWQPTDGGPDVAAKGDIDASHPLRARPTPPGRPYRYSQSKDLSSRKRRSTLPVMRDTLLS